MRANLILLAAVLLHPALIPPPASAADPPTPADRERAVRVALALAGTGQTCGKCREDVAEAKKEAISQQKPVALFVGGPCDGLGCAAELAGAIPAKTASYADERGSEKRIVILEPKPDRSGMWISDTLPANSSKAEVAAAVKKATPAKAAGKRLSWDF